ncbi:MAG: FG-GAP-like repeat-containing protein [Ignavibacteria bacterium]|nr:FG-GAP-like repeat-containing protein [Ignavibacteria bacterium]
MKNSLTFYSNIFKRKLIIFLFTALLPLTNGSLGNLFAQTFVKITDPSNPIATTNFANNYSGAAWIDYNNDGNLDLYSTKSFLFKGDGTGGFETINTDLGIGLGGQSNGPTWADYDNDGDIDCFIAGNPSRLYRNDGNDIFTEILRGDIGPDEDNRGWSSTWADIDNDGYTELFITHPFGFVGGNGTPSHLFLNNTDGTFIKNFDFEFSQFTAAYTIATWYDYDMDGDVDLFIGAGPALGPVDVDRLYQNMFIETGFATFERINTNPIATDFQDGQTWNWIDYDNDGDLDAFLTNYSGRANRFYVNENGTYINTNTAMNISGAHLGNSWGDFDNDGDLDVIITSESSNLYFRNDAGTFTNVNTAFTTSGGTRGSSIGDYDKDGKLDIFISGTGDAAGLFRNDTQNGNNWVTFDLAGTVSNRSALGAKIKLKSAIDGISVWQFREINSQNGFNSQNALQVHFGLGNAVIIDTVVVIWPSGSSNVLSNLSTNNNYKITESIPSGFLRADFIADKPEGFGSPFTVQFTDISVIDPNFPINSWEWDFDNDGIIDATEQNPQWTYNSIGTFTVNLTIQTAGSSESKAKIDYINVQILPGFPVITFEEPPITDTTVTLGTMVTFTVSAIDTTGYPLSYTWREDGFRKSTDTLFTYRASAFEPTPRTDTVVVEITNGFNNTFRTWVVHVESTTAAEDVINKLPTEFNLEQNYPNPFNPSTKIIFSIPQETNVILKVYNLLGKEVATLVNENKKPGFYELNFGGENLPSGVYVYRIEAGSFSSSKKMILLK